MSSSVSTPYPTTPLPFDVFDDGEEQILWTPSVARAYHARQTLLASQRGASPASSITNDTAPTTPITTPSSPSILSTSSEAWGDDYYIPAHQERETPSPPSSPTLSASSEVGSDWIPAYRWEQAPPPPARVLSETARPFHPVGSTSAGVGQAPQRPAPKHQAFTPGPAESMSHATWPADAPYSFIFVPELVFGHAAAAQRTQAPTGMELPLPSMDRPGSTAEPLPHRPCATQQPRYSDADVDKAATVLKRAQFVKQFQRGLADIKRTAFIEQFHRQLGEVESGRRGTVGAR